MIHAQYVPEDQLPTQTGEEGVVDLYSLAVRDMKDGVNEGCHFCILVQGYISSTSDTTPFIQISLYPRLPERNLGMMILQPSNEPPGEAKPAPVFQTLIIPDGGDLNFRESNSTRSDSHQRLVESWLDLVDPQSVSLHCPDSQKENPRYTTLSHCWGGATTIPKLTHQTLSQFKSGIRFKDLPRNFQDAISITRNLGLEYVWIDSLCIIQDSPSDWRTEASRMASVYENAYVTIAAAAAKDPFGGCFSARDSALQSACHIPAGISGTDFHVVPPWNVSRNKVNAVRKSALLSRGWVFQEMVLSPSVVFFLEDGIVWSCRKGEASEQVPTGQVPDRSLDGRPTAIVSPSSNSRYQNKAIHDQTTQQFVPARGLFKTILDTSIRVCSPSQGQKPWVDFSQQWLSIIAQYTRLNLTFITDRAIALSAIAQRVKEHSGLTYAAGLWEESLAVDLLWTTKDPKAAARPTSYLGPSWSWISVEGEISKDLWGSGHYLGRDPIVCIENARPKILTYPEDVHKTGQVQTGSSLELEGAILPCTHVDTPGKDHFGRSTWRIWPKPIGRVDPDSEDWFSFYPDIVAEVVTVDFGQVYLLPTVLSKYMMFQGKENTWGLALLCHGSYYTRVGTFATRTDMGRFVRSSSTIIIK
ncbi:hypothetical protein SAPIO_CDS4636 [Scedosporium apiospermum]|uniref:Heterokaryon incompatibility domain-containing protein n=1 Tax=Pseudallescheria apiosperma TaxID=563466 RepID=A0A084G7Y8_PSEDA|nr:uncharacterized protein SAPIO_CDS4636 [Scedosporium apiospermum]KEZ43450.1 hypothetical protein SAPIO_CDS4636 [Scedosporium apiospermum]